MEEPLELHWRRCQDMTIGMTFYPQAIVLRGKVYVGGGNCGLDSRNTVVTVYDPQLDTWSSLPRHGFAFFAMAVVHEKLTLIGGRDRVHKTTNLIVASDEVVERWRYNLTSLPTARDTATAVTYGSRWLIVAGGRDDNHKSLSLVDILDLCENQWHSGAPLPVPAHKMSAALLGNTLALLGGASSNISSIYAHKVFSVQLDDLISQAVSHQNKLVSPWHSLPDTPVSCCTALALNGALLAVGGNKFTDKSNAICIHLFKPSTRTWVVAGQQLINRWRCACAVLPSGEIFVAGGSTRAFGLDRIARNIHKEVHIAVLK